MRVAIVGCGSRHQMYRNALTGPYAGLHDLVALCDTNAIRLALSLEAAGGDGVRGYDAAEYGRMLAEQKPDTVIVCTPDFTHADYIVTALEAGCDVICEKPLATTAAQLERILEVQARTQKKVTVTFNYRYTPARTQIKELLSSGAIGEVTAVTFRWALDRVHGGDYFRRWHRQKDNSGGLLVHKSSHHFDLLNWWLDSHAVDVTATARRAFYTPEAARALGLEAHGERCATCPVIDRCEFALRLDEDENLRRLYKDAEGADGYFRDRCVFDPGIGIEDTYLAHIRYASGAVCNYSLVAYAPWEGFEVTFTGTEGELTHRHVEVHGIFGGTRPAGERESMTTTLHRAGYPAEEVKVASGDGDHGGGDPLILADLFARENAPDPFGRSADQRAGMLSILTGLAAERSAASGKTTRVAFDELSE